MIVLYKKGNTHTVRGVACIAGRFYVEELEQALSDGWITNPAKLKRKQEKKQGVTELRKKAKELGIKNYGRKSIEELKAEMNENNTN